MKITEKSMQTLCANPLFDGMDAKKLQAVIDQNGGSIRTIPAGELILSPKSEHYTIGMILSGKAIVTTPNNEKSVLLRYLRERDLFGIANLFTKEHFVSVIRAAVPCKVLYIPVNVIRHLLEHDRAFMYRYLEFLSGRICYLNRKIGYLTAGSAEQRLAVYLASFESDTVTLPLSLSALSELLDVGRASLYRACDRLTEDGFIEKNGRIFKLLNVEAMLRAYN